MVPVMVFWWCSSCVCTAGHYDKCVAALRMKHKEDLTPVLNAIMSHSNVQQKNLLVIALIVSTEHLS